MLFNNRLLNLFPKTYGKHDIDIEKMDTSHNHSVRITSLKTIQANNSRGERSLLCNGGKLYKRLMEKMGRLPLQSHGRSGRVLLGIGYAVSAVLKFQLTGLFGVFQGNRQAAGAIEHPRPPDISGVDKMIQYSLAFGTAAILALGYLAGPCFNICLHFNYNKQIFIPPHYGTV